MPIPQQQLDGLADVVDVIEIIMAGEFDHGGCVNPEPISNIMTRQVEHIDLIVSINADTDLSEFVAVASRARAWIAEAG